MRQPDHTITASIPFEALETVVSRLKLLVYVAFMLARAPVGALLGQDDPIAKDLGLTEEIGSLPVWTSSDPNARQRLGDFVRQAHQVVMLVGHPKHGYGTAWVVPKEH